MICPRCGDEVPEESIWFLKSKFYCSERCAKQAHYLDAGMTEDLIAQITT